jgi:hypothetical protein
VEGAPDLVLLARKGKSGAKLNGELEGRFISSTRSSIDVEDGDSAAKDRPVERRETAGTAYTTQGRRDGWTCGRAVLARWGRPM